MALKQQVRNIVPRRPNQWLKGTVSQQPTKAQQRYGAELIRPTSQVSLDRSLAIPNWYLYQICAPLTTVSSVVVNDECN